MLGPFLTVLLALCLVMACAYAIQRFVGNAGWVDVFWTFGTGFGGAVLATWPIASVDSAPWRQVMMALLMSFWALRLGSHIALRVARSDGEDPRYVRFRKEWGPDFDRHFFRFVIVQGPIAGIMAGCVGLAGQVPSAVFGAGDAFGLALFASGIAIEAIADRQMRRFRAQKIGPVCNVGLWSICRHPNYIGQWLLWCGVCVIALGDGGWGWLALSGPVLMGWLLRFVSGVPLLEKAMLESRGDAYRQYQAAVPAFLPLPPLLRTTRRLRG